MKKILLMIVVIASHIVCYSQVENEWDNFFNQSNEQFGQFKKTVDDRFESFRAQINKEYAAFMAEKWSPFDACEKIDIPWRPEPPRPRMWDPKNGHKAEPIPFITPKTPKPLPVPQPIEPIKPKKKPDGPTRNVQLFGTDFSFHYDKSRLLELDDVTEQSVANMWTNLSNDFFDNIIVECLQHRDRKHLCDWAYFLLTQKVSEDYCGMGSNESVVMHMYLLTQSGYQVRLARGASKLTVLIGSEETIYRRSYFELSGMKYYLMNPSWEENRLYIFNHAFPKEQSFSLVSTQPDFAVYPTADRTIVSRRYPNVKATIKTNRNLIDFYSSYPLSSQWQFYSMASLSKALKDKLYPVLREAIKGKSETEAANILINFVQTGFEYATDDQQFGYERPLFPDETFYYPYSDCEDRAILYSCLVRELMGLEVVLLHYPGHLASAVHFNENVEGDYLIVEGDKYIVCDPTYIGASIGMCMPDFKKVTANVVRFN